jgi:hypothetical protein
MPFDTILEAAAIQEGIFRRMTAAQRLSLALEMSESLRNVALAGLRSRRPDLDGDELSRELLRIMYEERDLKSKKALGEWRARRDSNSRPTAPEAAALSS